jgi:hypothetical protein
MRHIRMGRARRERLSGRRLRTAPQGRPYTAPPRPGWSIQTAHSHGGRNTAPLGCAQRVIGHAQRLRTAHSASWAIHSASGLGTLCTVLRRRQDLVAADCAQRLRVGHTRRPHGLGSPYRLRTALHGPYTAPQDWGRCVPSCRDGKTGRT